ncbi:3-oxoacyl-ACP reductase FabG [Bacillus sp. DTU_2020_1000418_1_SI_GHA_SEK_038]|uniref:3-oxoacyl-ACP reductase FabG n=1 Tax=Bacillus sp. DTU_2020_1000418_1_SI_GHA_SEK_038 TaxID=3077585 RepID=UPI0028E65F48|nr:3-oxoacyl-ACP reductase FabG [Bacillus sp. DTU_2020_1000418_1_SI_GHA_SEK_038]WNS76812.1 3-oxoacyl-ACP reductase FabG [Bacillus sp. DTU_2020_1000418_1_SI_GHA_SEK_038]
MRLKDKVAIITGAANGIGFAAVQTFAREGAAVALADFDADLGADRARELKEQGYCAEFFQVNVADRESINQMVSAVNNTFGKIDILINNAGITRDGMLTKLSAEDFQSVLDVNLTGVFQCTQAVLPFMLQQGKGKIINTSSVSGVYGNIGQTNYAATKAGVVGMTKTWAKELGRKGINVNAVAPGFINTGMTAKVPEKVIGQMKMMIPLERLGSPEDIANAYLFLASNESDYVNGTVLHVDGGIMM